jgi:5-methylcytosine-specific restriction enzyme A
MPSKPKAFCPRCGRPYKGRCECRGPARTETRSPAELHRKNVTYGRRWKAFRRLYLLDNPLCVDCLAAGIVAPATEAHHVVKVRDAPERQYDHDNLMPLCQSHHAKRTMRGE